MKHFQTLCAVAILFSLFFISCGKDPVPNNTNPVDPLADSYYLSKTYYTFTATAGDTSTRDYVYDNARRVTNIIDTSLVGSPFQSFGFTNYYYNGNDTLPYKSYHTNTGNFIDTTTQFYYYDISGRKIKDSIIRIFSDGPLNYQVYHTVNNFQYAPGKIYGYSVDSMVYTILGPATYRHVKTDTATLDANNYISSNIKHDWDGKIVHTEITNTTSKNPYSRLNIRHSFDVLPHGGDFQINNSCTSNNPSQIVHTLSGTGSGVYVNNPVYSFDINGYVTQETGQSPQLGATSVYKGILVYRSL